MSLYLTPPAKPAILAEWDQHKVHTRPAGDLGGRGFADPEVFDLVAAVNAFPYAATLQSCAGYVAPAADGSGDVVYAAQLWIWLERDVALAAADRLGYLAACSGFQQVGLVSRGDRVYLDVEWRSRSTRETAGPGTSAPTWWSSSSGGFATRATSPRRSRETGDARPGPSRSTPPPPARSCDLHTDCDDSEREALDDRPPPPRWDGVDRLHHCNNLTCRHSDHGGPYG